MVPWSLERKHTYRQYQLKSSYALWVTKIMPHFILLHNWTRISWHVLFIFLFCWLKTVFLFNDTIWGPECTFFKEPKTVYSHPKRVCWTTVTQRDVLPDDRHSIEWDVLPDDHHSGVRYLGWGPLFSGSYLILFSGFYPFFLGNFLKVLPQWG